MAFFTSLRRSRGPIAQHPSKHHLLHGSLGAGLGLLVAGRLVRAQPGHRLLLFAPLGASATPTWSKACP